MLQGDAKTEYQREYMRRRRAAQKLKGALVSGSAGNLPDHIERLLSDLRNAFVVACEISRSWEDLCVDYDGDYFKNPDYIKFHKQEDAAIKRTREIMADLASQDLVKEQYYDKGDATDAMYDFSEVLRDNVNTWWPGDPPKVALIPHSVGLEGYTKLKEYLDERIEVERRRAERARLKFLQHRPSPFFLSHLLPLTPPFLFPPCPPTLVGDKGGKGGFGGVGRRSKAGGEVDGGVCFLGYAWGWFFVGGGGRE